MPQPQPRCICIVRPAAQLAQLCPACAHEHERWLRDQEAELKREIGGMSAAELFTGLMLWEEELLPSALDFQADWEHRQWRDEREEDIRHGRRLGIGEEK